LRGLRGTGDVGPARTLALLHRRGLLGLLLRVAALEPLDPPARVDQLLLTRVERVAVRADLHAQLGPGAPGRERVPAGTVHGRDHVLGMDVRLHLRCLSLSSEVGRRPPGPVRRHQLTRPGPSRSPAGTARWTWWPGSCR